MTSTDGSADQQGCPRSADLAELERGATQLIPCLVTITGNVQVGCARGVLLLARRHAHIASLHQTYQLSPIPRLNLAPPCIRPPGFGENCICEAAEPARDARATTRGLPHRRQSSAE